MHANTGGQGLKVVAALQHRYDTALTTPIGDTHQFGGDPGKVRRQQAQVCLGIAGVGIKPGGDNEQLGTKCFEPGQQLFRPNRTEFFAPAPGASVALAMLWLIPVSVSCPVSGQQGYWWDDA